MVMTAVINPTGRQGNFEALVAPHRTPLLGHALRLTRSRADAEDLVQDTLLRAFEKFHTYRYDTDLTHSPRPWLQTILRNEFYNRYRARKRQGRSCSFEDVTEVAPAPQGRCLNRAAAHQICQSIATLPEEYRSVAALALLDDYSYEEITVTLGIPIGTVRSRLHRA